MKYCGFLLFTHLLAGAPRFPMRQWIGEYTDAAQKKSAPAICGFLFSYVHLGIFDRFYLRKSVSQQMVGLFQ